MTGKQESLFFKDMTPERPPMLELMVHAHTHSTNCSRWVLKQEMERADEVDWGEKQK